MPRRRIAVDPEQLWMWMTPPHPRCTHSKYGLSCIQFEMLRTRAQDCCEICGLTAGEAHPSGRPLAIDHEHRLGNGWDHVRGLLCTGCNLRLALVDSGQKRPTDRQHKYLTNAWHLAFPPALPADGPMRIPRQRPRASPGERRPAKYEQIAAELRGAIARGEYKIGDQLPSESELVSAYTVARMTARAAILTLVKDGLAHRVHGSGTYVGSLDDQPVKVILAMPVELVERIKAAAELAGQTFNEWMIEAARRQLDR